MSEFIAIFTEANGLTTYATIEADTEDEAIKKAEQKAVEDGNKVRRVDPKWIGKTGAVGR